MTEIDNDLSTKVRDWIRTRGYPLEMRVADALQTAGFSVVQSAYFGDAETGKSRELDVIAFKTWKSENIQWQLMLLVECKVSKKKPWLMFTRDLRVDETEKGFQFYRAPASRLGKQLILTVRRLSSGPAVLPLLAFADRPAYGLQMAAIGEKDESPSESRRDPAYDAATKIAQAALLHADAVDSAE